MEIKEKIKKILEGLNEGVFEKEEVIRLSLLSAIAGESIFLLGLPGVAKSLIARRLKFAFMEAKSFEYLMNKFSTPDEIFGPVSVMELQKDNYRRITENYLPDSHIVFLDEIWKAGPAIQNTLLTVLNEKIFHNGKEVQKVPLRGLIAASNELPAEDEGLEALWDRFLIRYIVEGIQNTDNFNKMISDDLNPSVDNIVDEIKISEEEYIKWSKEIDQIILPEEVFKVIDVIRKKIQDQNKKPSTERKEIYISDRRWRKIIRILRTSAFLNGRIEVDLMDCFLIQHCIWNEEEDVKIIKKIISESIKDYGYTLTIDINSIEEEIAYFQKEVKEQTEIYIKTDTIKFLEYTNNKIIYYKIEKPDINREIYPYIRKTDFQKLNNDSDTEISLFDFDSNQSKLFQYIQLSENGNSIKIDIDANNNYYEFILEREESEKLTKKPNKYTLDGWNNKKESILREIENQKMIIQNHKKDKLGHLHTNLFVNKALSSIVEENLYSISSNLDHLILEVEKIKAYYDGLE